MAASTARWVIRGAAVCIVLGSLVAGALVLDRRGPRSEEVTGRWDLLNDQAWLLPNLDRALVVVPDRPHRREEVDALLDEGRVLEMPDQHGASKVKLEHSVELERIRSYTLTTNSWRLRGGPLREEKVGPRIAVLGDSVAMGHGVDDEDAWPLLMEQILAQEVAGVEVLNAGCPATSLQLMVTWCKNVGTQLDLDLLIWASRGVDNGMDPEGASISKPVPSGIFRQQVQDCQRSLDVPVVVVLNPTSAFDLRSRGVVDTQSAELARHLDPIAVLDLNPAFRAEAMGRGETLVVDGSGLEIVDQETGHVWLKTQRDGHELPLDVYALFEEEEEVSEALFFDGAHPTVEGNALYARLVADFVAPML